mmetsp:Transcript_13835/g.16051  ORF Transcript_13835/g.16051 Transcript_13835/m.16051 type:complete len:89 (+) Transcript_13835:159-425(+)
MILMQQMQAQQKGLHKLIQEFRDSNADKLLEENQQLQDRLYQLELDEKQINQEDMGYHTMPIYEGKRKKRGRRKNSTIVIQAKPDKMK